MRDAVYGSPVYSLPVAIACIVALIYLSQVISRSQMLRRPLVKLGAASMGIMFIHLEVFNGFKIVHLFVHHPYALALCVTFMSLGIVTLLMRIRVARAFLFGSEPDFLLLTRSRSGHANQPLR